jgi:hypothetical protein
MFICKFLNMKIYPEWIGLSHIKLPKDKIIRLFKQFTPYNWTSYNWNIFKNFKRFFGFILLMIGVFNNFKI